jgi:hypothetical protein
MTDSKSSTAIFHNRKAIAAAGKSKCSLNRSSRACSNWLVIGLAHKNSLTNDRGTLGILRFPSSEHHGCERDQTRTMKIAQIAPLYESVPPKLYGGTERIVSYLTEELL